VHHSHPAGDHADEVHVVLDDDHGGHLVEPLQEPDGLLDLFHRHPGRRLVEQDQGRLADAGHADLQPLRFSPWESHVAWGCVGPLLQPTTSSISAARRRPSRSPNRKLRGEVQILVHAQLLEDASPPGI
jgi:hypothetical protein